MKAVVQRVSSARVEVDGETTGEIAVGLLVLLGVAREDEERDAAWMAEKVVGLRIFEDDEGKMNRSLQEVEGALLAVSQFTLLGDSRKGRRPSFIDSAPAETAEGLYGSFASKARSLGARTEAGKVQG